MPFLREVVWVDMRKVLLERSVPAADVRSEGAPPVIMGLLFSSNEALFCKEAAREFKSCERGTMGCCAVHPLSGVNSI